MFTVIKFTNGFKKLMPPWILNWINSKFFNFRIINCCFHIKIIHFRFIYSCLTWQIDTSFLTPNFIPIFWTLFTPIIYPFFRILSIRLSIIRWNRYSLSYKALIITWRKRRLNLMTIRNRIMVNGNRLKISKSIRSWTLLIWLVARIENLRRFYCSSWIIKIVLIYRDRRITKRSAGIRSMS